MGTSLLDLPRRWSTFPVVEAASYLCTNCGAIVGESEPSCPECGGDVAEMTHSSMELFWPHHRAGPGSPTPVAATP